jgi:pantoate--beta-alanine ligase
MQREALSWQRTGTAVGLVPTMGYLHAGHMSLVAEARNRVGPRGKVVLSIYVNPTQFGPNEDLSRYPRDLKRDLRLCREAGVDVVFTPDNQAMYPGEGPQAFSTYVAEERLSRVMEGESRPTHFRGVTTVVAKLFNIVQPHVAVFGAKDYQQATIVRRMVRDLNFPIRIITAPTVREPDGLAMSSRNKYLLGSLRQDALVVSRTINEVRQKLKAGAKSLNAKRLKTELAAFVRRTPSARLDYVEFFDPETLVAAAEARRGTHMALAVFVGKTRLIDNARL